ncbi:MAG: AAA family ATPase [Thermomicrobiales bacterium]
MPHRSATRVHLTGMSGTGKSTTLQELARRGWTAIDTDEGDWLVPDTDGEMIWDAEQVRRLLEDQPHGDRLVIAGTVRNQGHFREQFDAVVLLTAPLPVMLDRVSRRTTNPYGSTDAQRDEIRANTREVLPVLRARPDLVLDTSVLSPSAVADAIEAATSRHDELAPPVPTDPV